MDATSSFEPVEHIPAGDTTPAVQGLLFVCDHAANTVPPEVGDLGLTDEDMARHIAWDVGARGVTLGLAANLNAEAVLSTFSRLVIDPNRGPDDPTLVMQLYDGSIIPGNRGVGATEIERRLDAYYRPYHRSIDAAIDRIQSSGHEPVLVSLHSFTPAFRGRAIRPWHIGLLWDEDDRLVRPLLSRLQQEPDLFVGDNEPYSGQLKGDCMFMHGTMRDVPHVLIEIRNDLIEEPGGQQHWADRLTPVLIEAIAEMRLGKTKPDAI